MTSLLKRPLITLINNQLNNQIRSISTSKLIRSDALFVHRETDNDVKDFKFDEKNLKVIKFYFLIEIKSK